MKKYIIFIILMGLVLGAFLVNNIIKTQESRTKEFYNSGYILQAMSEKAGQEKIETYYFNENEKYKNLYNTKTEFKDINNTNVVTSNENFIHYKDNSISALKKGVIINLEEIEKDPICYYSLAAGKVLKFSGEGYLIQNLSEELHFQKFIYKLSDNKYLIAGNNLKIRFNDGTEKTIEDGYIEFEYCDNKIVKLYNKEINYQTVSSEVYIQIDDITLDLGTTIISKNTENKMSLGNMVIDSDDNIEIVDISQEEKENKEETNSIDAEGQTQNDGLAENGGTTNNSETVTNNQSQGIVVEGENTGAPDESEEKEENKETFVPETEENSAPIYRVEEFEVDAISLNTRISINGNVESLVSDTVVSIVNNRTQEIIEEETYPINTNNIDFSVAKLTPDTEYTLIAENTYQVGDVNYTKNFVYKVFKTHSTGVTFEKDYFTDSSLSFNVHMEKDSKIQSAKLAIFNADDAEGNPISTSDEIKSKEGQKTSTKVEFVDLKSDTEYKIKLVQVQYGGEEIANGIEEAKVYKTLKKSPQIDNTVVQIDKRNSNFIASINNVEDLNLGIKSYKCEVYSILDEESAQPVYVATSTENVTFTVPVDGVKILRDAKYIFKFIITFYDNEKIVEYEQVHGEAISMDSSEFPTIRFEEEEITFERIKGTICITDNGYTVDAYDKFIIQYTDSLGNTKEIKYQGTGSLNIPININNLRANDTYSFVLKGKVDLKDGNDPIEDCYIDTIVIKTKKPDNMRAEYAKNSNGYAINNLEDTGNVFAVSFRLTNEEGNDTTLESNTLTGMKISLYSGTDIVNGTKIKEVQLKDTNVEQYESTLKEQFYDNEKLITPQFFGLTNAQLQGSEYYTIKISNAHDYTVYQNDLPILDSEIKIKSKKYVPTLPEEADSAITVEKIRNRDAEIVDDKLDAETIVAYKLTAKFDNTQKIGRRIYYKIYDANTNELIKEETIIMNPNSDEVPSLTINVEEGTDYSTKDTDFVRRGNSYYFTYEVDVELEENGTIHRYPLADSETGETPILKTDTETPKKQMPIIKMYPSVSTANSIVFKYTCLDIDNAIELKNNSKYMNAYIGSSLKSSAEIDEIADVNEEYKIITFDNLLAGDLQISIDTRLIKQDKTEKTVLCSQYFEGINDITSIEYNVNLTDNKVEIELSGEQEDLDKIAAYRITYSADGVEDFVVPFATAQYGKLSTNLSDLGESFLSKEITVKLEAYYDSGIVGYDVESDYYIFQKAYLSSETPYYYFLKDDGVSVLTEQKEALESLYKVSRTENIITLNSPINNKSANIELAYSEGGFKYGYGNILQKKIELKQQIPYSNNIFKFDLIVPGIRIYNEQGNLQILAGLDIAEIDAEIVNTKIFKLQNNEIEIEVYKTNDKGEASEYQKTVTVSIDEFANTVEINGLEPKQNYYIQFKTRIEEVIDSGIYVEKYLYDLNREESGVKYYFNTLNDIGVNDINVQYKPEDYTTKQIEITYNVQSLPDYIVHEIYERNDTNTGYKDEPKYTEKFTVMDYNISKSFNANPGDGWNFGSKYLLKIKPYKDFVKADGTIEAIPIWTNDNVKNLEKEFNLDALREPMVMITSSRDQANQQIKYSVTINDDDKIIEFGKYNIEVLEDDTEIISEENIGIDEINKQIVVESADFTKIYKIIVYYNLDYNNSGTIEENEKASKEYVLQPINKYGIRIGSVNISLTQDNKVQLNISDTYNLDAIKYINYKVASNTQNFSVNKKTEFIRKRVDNTDDYWTFVLEEAKLEQTGLYFIELQFLSESGDLLDAKTLQYIYQ